MSTTELGAGMAAASSQGESATDVVTRPPAITRFLRSRRLHTFALQIAFLVVVAGAWQLCSELKLINPLFVSKPTAVVSAFYQLMVHGTLLSSLGTTLYETVVGFVISVVAGLATALLFLEVPLLERAASPYITSFNNLPRLALAPLFVLWFGIGSFERIVLVITMVYFIILISAYSGLQVADRDQLILARTLGASRWQTFVHFRVPAAMPTLFSGLQLGLTYSFTGAVIAELLAGGTGLGAQLSTYQASYDTSAVFADLLLMAIVATLLSKAMSFCENHVLRWRKYELRNVKKA